jgi:nucleotide-binding universal stress UspA family protein
MMTTPKIILVATDFGAASDSALAYGRALSHAFGATLHVLHVRENNFFRPMASDPRTLEKAALHHIERRLTDEDRRELHARAILETSDATAEAIVDYARENRVELIVMGTHGRTGIDHVLAGSIAEHVVRSAPCPVLTVRCPEREFVVPSDSLGQPVAPIA